MVHKAQNNRLKQQMMISIGFGLVFAILLFGYTAMKAQDGRTEITTWLDPFLASATLTGMIGCQLLLLLAWEQVKESIGKSILAVLMVAGEWFTSLAKFYPIRSPWGASK